MDNQELLVYCSSAMQLQARRLHKRDLQKLRAKARRERWPLSRDELKAQDIAPFTQAQIIKRLNGAPNSHAVRRVSKFINLFNRATELNASFRLFFESRDDMMDFLYQRPSPAVYTASKDHFSSGWKFKFPEMESLNTQLNRVLAELNKLAKRYNWHPFIRHMGYETPFDVTETWKARDAEQGWETFAIWWMCKRNGEWIDRFRQCNECGTWFFALADHQSYCRDACRKRHASRSEEFKERRRLYMHDYRRAEKQRDSKAKTAARRAT